MSVVLARNATTLRLPAVFAGWDGASRLVLMLLAVVVLLTFPDYGATWDEPRQQRYGELALEYYRTLGADRSVFGYYDLYLYGAAFDLVAAALARTSPFEVYETRHLLNALVGLLGLVATWRLARDLAGPRAGFLALVLLAASPDWYGHMFGNPKDIPFAAAMTWGVYYLVRVSRTLPRPSACTVLALGAAAGLALGTRVAGGMLLTYAAILVAGWTAIQVRTAGWTAAFARASQAAFGLVPAVILAWLVMLTFWPWAHQAPFSNPLAAARTFSHFPQDTAFVYAGEVVRSTGLPWHYIPVMLLVRLPEPVLLGLALSPLAAAYGRPWSRTAALGWTAVTLATLVPLAVILGTGAVLYDGIRHVLFLVPLVAVVAAAALDRVWERIPWQRAQRGLAAAGAVWLAAQVVELVELHPHQYILYNRLVGGVAGAAGRFELDFWGTSIKETTEELVAAIVARRGEGVLNRPLRVLVCGPVDSVRPYVPDPWLVLDARRARAGDLFVVLSKMPCRLPGVPRVLASTEEDGAVLSSAGTLYEP